MLPLWVGRAGKEEERTKEGVDELLVIIMGSSLACGGFTFTFDSQFVRRQVQICPLALPRGGYR